MSKIKGIRLDVGGGSEPLKGYVNVDFYAFEADVKALAWDLPYSDAEVSEINCSHMLEHVEKRRVHAVLREFHRVLKPGGLLAIEVPDLVWCCKNWLASQDDGWNLDAVFGNQDPPGGQTHMTGFTELSLPRYLREAGFGNAAALWKPWTHNQMCIHVEVIK